MGGGGGGGGGSICFINLYSLVAVQAVILICKLRFRVINIPEFMIRIRITDVIEFKNTAEIIAFSSSVGGTTAGGIIPIIPSRPQSCFLSVAAV